MFEPVDQELNALAEEVIGAAIEVHRHLGAGFQELTYQRALAIELRLRNISIELEVPVQLEYKNQSIGEGRIDILVDGRLILELKAVEPNPRKYKRQVVAYLKATGLRLGLIINFKRKCSKTASAELFYDFLCAFVSPRPL